MKSVGPLPHFVKTEFHVFYHFTRVTIMNTVLYITASLYRKFHRNSIHYNGILLVYQ